MKNTIWNRWEEVIFWNFVVLVSNVTVFASIMLWRSEWDAESIKTIVNYTFISAWVAFVIGMIMLIVGRAKK